MRTVDGPDRPRRRRRRRARRAVRGAAAGRRRPPGHRARARGRARRARRRCSTRRRLPVRHRPDRADDARPHRRRARLRRRAARGLARRCGRSTRSTARTTPTARRSTCTPTSTRWPPRSRAVCGPDEAAGYRRYVDFVSKLYRYEMRDFIDRNIDSPLDLLTPNLARLAAIGGFRRLAPKVAQYLQGPAHAAGVLVPVDVRRALAVRRARDLRGHRLHGLGRRRVLPARAACTRCRGRWPARRRSTASSSGTARRSTARRASRTAGRSRVHTADGERIAVRRRRAQPRPAGRLPRPARPATPRRCGGCATRRRASCCSPARRAAYTKTAHHNIHFGAVVAGGVRRADRRAAADERPVAPGHQPDPLRPVAGARRRADLLRAVPDAEPRRADIDWDVVGAALPRRGRRARSRSAATSGFGDAIEVETRTTPLDWAAAAWSAGRRSRPRTRSARPGRSARATSWGENVVFAGSGTQPGVGVPMVLISGRLAAERILGPDPAYRSRAWV